MKKALSAVLAVVLVLGVCFSVPMIASANDANDFTYELDNAENPTGYIITGVKDGVTGPVEIPATYKPEGNINVFYPKAQETVNLGEVTGVTVVINGEGDEDDHGTVTVSEETVEEITTVTLEMEPEAGYTLKSITVGEKSVETLPTADENGVYTYAFTPEAEVTVTVAFTASEYTVTVTQPTGGEISASPEKGVKGDEITLTAEADDEYTFERWIVTGATVDENNKFVIGTENVTVTAEFSKTTYGITYDEETIAAYVGGEVVTVAAKDAEVVIKPVDATKIVETVTVKDAEDNDIENLTVTGNKFTMPGEAVKVAATLVQGYDVNVAATENGTVTVNKTLAAEGDFITVTTTPATGYKLGTLKVAYAGAEGEQTVTAEADGEHKGAYEMPAAAVTVTATFVKEEYTITLPGTNKDGKVTNGEIAITSAKDTYHFGDAIALTLTPAGGCQLGTLTYTYEGLETPVAIENGSFSMPAKNITINVTFVPKEMDVIGIKAGALNGATGVTAFTVADGQDLFVAEDGVLFEKVEGGLKLIAFPAAYEVEEGEDATYTIPAKVPAETGLAVTEVADGAFQALGDVEYVFCEGTVTITESAQPAFGSMSDDETPVFVSNKKFHTTTGHTEDDGEITTPATCQVDGVKTFKCEDCEAVLRTESVHDANAHRFLTENDGWVVETPATCIYDGIQRRYCQNQGCNYVETETIDATEKHVAGEGVILEGDEATCTEEGTKTFYCTGCKTEVVKTEKIDALGHEISDPDVVVKATCTEDGYVKGICDNCETEQTIPETKKGHKMITVVDAEATCTVAGSQHEECETCGYMDEDAVIGTIPALGHSKAEETAWTIVTEATCAEAGLLQKFCDTCHTPLTDKDGKEITRVLEATGEHEYKDYKETKAPTCTEKGAETGTCACGATDVREVKALGHEFAEEFTTDKEATCTEAGSKSKHCTRTGCEEKSEVTAIPVIPHTLPADAETVTPATCHSVGTKKGTCTICKTADVTVEIPMLAHTWAETAVPVVGTITKENVPVLDAEGKPVLDEVTGEPKVETITYKAATCEAEGYTVKYCTVEGCDAYDEASLTKVDKLGHDFDETHDAEKPSNIQPTCDEVGYKFVWCKTCSEANKDDENKGYVKVEVAATGHDWEEKAKNLKEEIEIEVDGEKVTAKAPDCENPGYTAIYCATCGDYKDVTPVAKLGHSVLEENWTTKSEATCIALKVEKNTCNRCDEEVTREVGKLADHDFSETKTTVYPTCEEDGVEYFACKTEGCKARNQEKVLEALGHDHGDNKLVGSEPTCTTAGVKTQACTRLFYEDGSLYVAPSTDENDTPTTGDSNANGDTGSAVAEGDEPTLIPCEGLTVTTPATGHAFSDEYTTDVEPTCTEDGEKSRHCTNEGCDETTGTLPVKALGHEFGEKYTVDTKATCSSVGYESIHCTRYDDCETKKTGSTREIPKTDHTYDDVNGWVVDVRATCTTEGSRHNDCKVCGENGRKTEKIAALGHDIANATLQTKAATCLADGETYKLCERYIETAEGVKKCGEKVVIEELEATGHNVEEWNTEANPATCTTAGSKTGTCQNANCPNEGKLVTETIPATGHKFDTQPARTEPTCTEPGRITGTCSVCEKADVYNEIPAKGHTWGDWELAPVAEGATADCTVQGGMIRYCTVANCDGSELGKNDEHTVSGWIIGENATCGADGEMHTECKVCAKVIETEAIKATGKHTLKETVTKAPTCIDAGEKTVECTADGCNYTATVAIPANGHSYTDWKVFVEPTCTTKGIRQSVCEVCLTTQSEKILALGHDLGEFIVDEPAKCNVKGSQHKECSRCDYTETAEIAALEHKFVGNDCANKCGAKIYEYALVEGSTTDIIITKYNGSDENLVIPAEIDGYKVVAIGNRAFMKTVIVPGTPATETTEATEDTITYVESDFTSLTIPASITSIGDYAFANSKLTLVNIPATVTEIGKCAFGYDVVITMEPAVDEDEEETQTPAEGETPVEDEEVELVEKIVATKVAGFTIYGVKDSAAEAYAKQDAAEGEEYNFTFVEVKNVYDVVIDEEETNIVEVADGVIFKEFEPVDEADDSTKIANQIKAVIELPENSDYTVDVEASLSGVINEGEDDETSYAFYGTGSKILVKDGDGKVVDEIVVIIEGDVNGDSVVDAIDCMLIQLAATANSTRPLEGVYYTAGNITADSAITADDLSAAVLKIFGEDLVVEKEEETTVTTTAAPTTEATTEATTAAPTTEATTEATTVAPTTEATSEATTVAPTTEATTEATTASTTTENSAA